MRVRIVLACAEPAPAIGASNSAVPRALGVSRPTVITWRGRFAIRRLDGLLDGPQPGAPRTITDADVERVLVTTLETTPVKATHWSTRLLADELGMSQTAVSRIWRAFALQPHRWETFKLSKDPLFIEKVRDIVGLCLSPPGWGLALCVEEKRRIQATEGTTPVARPSHARRADAPRPGRAAQCGTVMIVSATAHVISSLRLISRRAPYWVSCTSGSRAGSSGTSSTR